MRWKPKNLAQWHRWYAWHPVWTGDSWVWLEDVQRRAITVTRERYQLCAEPWGDSVEVSAWEYR